MDTPFTPARADGRSDRQVVVDLVSDSAPDAVFTYADICKALQAGLSKPVRKQRVYPAVGQANGTLLREHHRYLTVVRGRGYKVCRGNEHLPLAVGRKGRAEKQMRLGIEILKHVRIDELTNVQQQQHAGQLLVMSGLYSAMRESQRRHEEQEGTLAGLADRVKALESQHKTY